MDNQAHSASAEEPEFDLGEVVQALREFRWLIAAITALVLATVTVWTLRTPKIYEAKCTVEYDPNPSRPLGGQVDDVADPIGNFWATREFFGTQNLVIASRGVAERAVLKLGLHEDPTYLTQDEDTPGETGNLEATAIALQSHLNVAPVPDTRLVQILAREGFSPGAS